MGKRKNGKKSPPQSQNRLNQSQSDSASSPDQELNTPKKQRVIIDETCGDTPVSKVVGEALAVMTSSPPTTSQPDQGNPEPLTLESPIHSAPPSLHSEPPWVQTLLSKMSAIDDKLSHVCNRVSLLESEMRSLHELNKKVAEIEDSMHNFNKHFETVRNELEKSHSEMTTLSSSVKSQSQEVQVLKQRINDLENRSMRDNLLFTGIAEQPQEDAEGLVKTLIKDKLGITNNVEFERVHRIGPHNPTRTRSIVAKFSRHKGRELVRTSAHKLAGTRIGIHEQYGRDVAEKRKILYPRYKAARESKKFARFTFDSLVIESERFKVDDSGVIYRDPRYSRPPPPRRENQQQQQQHQQQSSMRDGAAPLTTDVTSTPNSRPAHDRPMNEN